jgi:ATP-dependent metalloprotease
MSADEVDRILMGAERKSHYVTEESKKMTAYHEGGHALVALHTKGAMPLHKVTIMPRGQALGITFQLPEQDKGMSSLHWVDQC